MLFSLTWHLLRSILDSKVILHFGMQKFAHEQEIWLDLASTHDYILRQQDGSSKWVGISLHYDCMLLDALTNIQGIS